MLELVDLTLLFRGGNWSPERKPHYHFTQEKPYLLASFLFQMYETRCWMALGNETNALELRFQNDQILSNKQFMEYKLTLDSGTLRTPCFFQAEELAWFSPQLIIYVLYPWQGQTQSLDSVQLRFADQTGEHTGLFWRKQNGGDWCKMVT